MARAACGLGVCLALVAGVQDVASAKLEGARGFERAMKKHERTGKPILLFVYTDWCPYCRTFMDKTLRSQIVRRYMTGISEVWLNPEDGKRELAIAEKYGVRSYPTIFMFPWNTERPRRINRAGPSAFVEICKAAAGTPSGAQSTRGRRSSRSKTPSIRDTLVHATSASPDGPTVTVYLKGGEVVRGQYISDTSGSILIKTDDGERTCYRMMIDHIDFE